MFLLYLKKNECRLEDKIQVKNWNLYKMEMRRIVRGTETENS